MSSEKKVGEEHAPLFFETDPFRGHGSPQIKMIAKRLGELSDAQLFDVLPPATRDTVIPPLNFALVQKGVYRSGYPNERNFPFLVRLRLKSVLYLSKDAYRAQNLAFVRAQGIELFHVPLEGSCEPFVVDPEEHLQRAVKLVLDPANHPILIHCANGKHRTGCVVGCLRKCQRMSLSFVFDEYRRFAGKLRLLDQQLIEIFELEEEEEPVVVEDDEEDDDEDDDDERKRRDSGDN